jgi:hypothetical protein
MMTDKIYRGTTGVVVIVDCGQDISTATDTKMRTKHPGGKVSEWTATIYGTNYLKYTTVDGDLDETGTYGIQSSMTLGVWTGTGKTAYLKVYEPGE